MIILQPRAPTLCASRGIRHSHRSLYMIFGAPRAAEGYLFKGYLPPSHKLKAPYYCLIL